MDDRRVAEDIPDDVVVWPREGPMACAFAPFAATGRGVRLHISCHERSQGDGTAESRGEFPPPRDRPVRFELAINLKTAQKLDDLVGAGEERGRQVAPEREDPR